MQWTCDYFKTLEYFFQLTAVVVWQLYWMYEKINDNRNRPHYNFWNCVFFQQTKIWAAEISLPDTPRPRPR
tara:strand:- start:2466 stop:2678 length:213 start_codon:yes stop_codon:yes gene_type:complete